MLQSSCNYILPEGLTFANQIYGVRPLDPLVIGGVTVLLEMVALASCAVPAWRAVQVDPVAVLKKE